MGRISNYHKNDHEKKDGLLHNIKFITSIIFLTVRAFKEWKYPEDFEWIGCNMILINRNKTSEMFTMLKILWANLIVKKGGIRLGCSALQRRLEHGEVCVRPTGP
jgi:hypothetical protein